ncbi:TetR/AcrR family transcriptional regulator [Nocardia caishijiensis]|uniref:TetR/AcrR family transcriptional regulator n=1 Tax=Nocardia caishijiensis TaxID=184756 RepID=UPI001916D204|nr:TetR/AcrR family transcriptional regulator [Nocardia caishijiensis]
MTTSGPRKAETIYLCALELLARDGYDNLTMEAVARQSGVNKTTLYRWWPSKDALLAAALTVAAPLRLSIPDTGGFAGDLVALGLEIGRLLSSEDTSPIVRAVLSASAARPELASVGQRFFGDRLARERVIFDRAVARGEISAGLDPAFVIDLLAGSLWTHVVLRGETFSESYVRTVVGVILRGVSSPTV